MLCVLSYLHVHLPSAFNQIFSLDVRIHAVSRATFEILVLVAVKGPVVSRLAMRIITGRSSFQLTGLWLTCVALLCLVFYGVIPRSVQPLTSQSSTQAVLSLATHQSTQAIVITHRNVSSVSSQQRKRVLVVVFSQTRGWRSTFDSLQRHLLTPLDADLALCVSEPVSERAGNHFYSHAKYVFSIEEPENYTRTAMHEASALLGDNAYSYVFAKAVAEGQDWGPLEGRKGSGFIVFWMRKVCARLMAETVKQYSWVVLTRSDHLFLVDHPPLAVLDSIPDKVLVPAGEDYRGVTDRHAVVPAPLFMKALAVLDWAMRAEYNGSLTHARSQRSFTERNAESVLKFYWQAIGLWRRVVRFDRPMFSVREKNGTTRWSEGRYDAALGLYIKYDSEYALATATAKRSTGSKTASWCFHSPGTLTLSSQC